MSAMSNEDLSAKLRHAEAELFELRSKISSIQKDVDRKDKRLGKATSRATKLEGLLMQTESEAEQLRAKCTETEALADGARRSEAALLIKFENISSGLKQERDTLIQKSDKLSNALSEKLLAIDDLQRKVQETQGLVQCREKELQRSQEEQQDKKREMLAMLSEKEDLVSNLESMLLDEKRAYQLEFMQVSDQRNLHQKLLVEKEALCSTLRSNLEDSTLAIFNLQLRLKEIRHDADLERHELQNALSFKENEVLNLEKLIVDKSKSIDLLSSEVIAVRREVEERSRAFSDSEDRLRLSGESLAKVQQEHLGVIAEMKDEAGELRSSLVLKTEQLSRIKELHASRTADSERRLNEAAQKHHSIEELLDQSRNELQALSSKHEVSQRALKGVQRLLSESTTLLNDRVHSLEDQMATKEQDFQRAKVALEEESCKSGEELETLTEELKQKSALVEERDANLLQLQQQLLQSERSVVCLKGELREESCSSVSREKELHTKLADKGKELDDQLIALEKAREEYRVLQTECGSVKSSLEKAEAASKNTISLLNSQLVSAQQECKNAVSECSEHQNRLQVLDQNYQEQSADLDRLRHTVIDFESCRAEYNDKLHVLLAEKEALELKLQQRQEQLRVFEEEKAATVEDLKVIYMERDELNSCIEQLKESSSELVLQAQDEADKRIADLSVKNNELTDQLREKHVEADELVKEMHDLNERFIETERASKMVESSLEEVSLLKREQAELQEKLFDAEQELEKTRAQIEQLSIERAEREALLSQEIRETKSSLQSKDILLEQFKNSLTHARDMNQGLESENTNMKSIVAGSNRLLHQAGDENQKIVNVLSSSQAEFEKTLESTSRMLKTSQESEQTCRAAYRFLLERLQNLKVTCGFEKQGDQPLMATTPLDLHSEVNVVIVQLEEHFQASKYLEKELSDAVETCALHEESKESLVLENKRLQTTLEHIEEQAQERNEQIDSLSKREKELQAQVLVLNEKVTTQCRSKQDLSEEKASIQSAYDEAMESIALKDKDMCVLRSLVDECKTIAATSADKLIAQEQAAEVALTSLQRHLKELELEITDLSTKQQTSEADSIRVHNDLEKTSEERDALTEKLSVLSETHGMLVNTLNGEREQWQEESEAIRVQLKLSTETLQALETSSAKALEKERENTASTECRVRDAERKIHEFQEKLLDVAEEHKKQQRKQEVALGEKEDALRQHKEELQKFTVLIASLEAQKAVLEEENMAKQKELKDSFEAKFHKASENEDKQAAVLKEKLRVAKGEGDSVRKELAALHEELCAERERNIVDIAGFRQDIMASTSAHESVLQQKDSIAEELERQMGVNDKLVITIGELREQVASRESSASALSEKLRSSAISIAALEARNRSLKENLVGKEEEHSAVIDDLLNKLEIQKSHMDEERTSKTKGERLSEKRLLEIERLEDVVKKLKGEWESTKLEAAQLETNIERKAKELGLMQANFAEERESLTQKCTDLFTRNSMAREELEARQSQLKAMQAKSEAAQRQLVAFSEETARRDGEYNVLQDALLRQEADVEQFKSALEESSNAMEAKAQSLAQAQTTIADLSARLAELESSPREANQNKDGAEQLGSKNTELQRRGERLGVRSKKLARRLKRVEKLLAAEKRKNQSLQEISVKRQVSPSTKGMSPAMKRIRDQERREPLSPIPSNARPPRPPKVSVRHLHMDS